MAVGTGDAMKKENENKNDEIRYVKASLPDKKELIRLINVGKGEGRSMEKYAVDCDRSPASFSRIVHGGFQRPLSEKLIRDMVINSGGRLTLEQMMRANGMVPVGEVQGGSFRPGEKAIERNSEQSSPAGEGENKERVKKGRLLSYQISDIIQEYLYERDYKLRGSASLPAEYYSPDQEKYGLSFRTDIDSGRFALRVEGYEPRYWYFLVSTLLNTDAVHDEAEEDDENTLGAGGVMEVFMSQYARFFLKDIWEPEMMRDVRITFVLSEREKYEVLRDSLKDRKMNGCFSLILVDLRKSSVEDEFILSRMNG